jgi:hypothetical protein
MRKHNPYRHFVIILALLGLLQFAGCGDDDPAEPGGGGTAPATGTVNIDAEPDALDAPWVLTGPDKAELSGSGDQTLTELEVGQYSLAWGDVADWTSPLNNPVAFSLSEDQEVTFIGRYYQVEVQRAFDSLATSQRPDGIIFRNDRLWVNEVNDNTIFEMDPEDGSSLGTLSVPGLSHDLAFDGVNIWLTTYWDDPPFLRCYQQGGDLVRELAMPAEMAYPTAMTYDQVNDVIWTVNTNSPEDPKMFWKIDAADGSILESWELAGGTPPTTYGLCMDADPDFLWGVAGDRLFRISIAGRSKVAEYILPAPAALLTGVDQVSANEFWLVTNNVDEDHIFKVTIITE